jgi:hypothetical protein
MAIMLGTRGGRGGYQCDDNELNYPEGALW